MSEDPTNHTLPECHNCFVLAYLTDTCILYKLQYQPGIHVAEPLGYILFCRDLIIQLVVTSSLAIFMLDWQTSQHRYSMSSYIDILFVGKKNTFS